MPRVDCLATSHRAPLLGTRARTVLAAVLCTLAGAVALSGCGADVPPVEAPNSLPVAGVGRGAIGVIRLDLERLDDQSLARWIGRSPSPQPSTDRFLGKLLLARDGLMDLGFLSAVVVIPSIDSLPEEIGVYLGGPEGVDREQIEDVFLRAGGLNIAGFSMSAAFARDLGEGWYFFGWGEDGVLEDQDADRTAELCSALAHAPRAAATLLILADGSELITPDLIPEGEARATRRIRALAEAAQGMRSFMVAGGGEAGIEWRVQFVDADAAQAAAQAVRKTLEDAALMAEGSAAVGEIDEEDLLGWQRLAKARELETRDSVLVLRAGQP